MKKRKRNKGGGGKKIKKKAPPNMLIYMGFCFDSYLLCRNTLFINIFLKRRKICSVHNGIFYKNYNRKIIFFYFT